MNYLNNLITYLVIYDIHFGHGKNPTQDIINGLYDLFALNLESFKALKTIFFTGDVFDKLIHLSSDDSIRAQIWINNLLDFCSEHEIQIRVLEGTPLHDRGQSRCFELLAHGKNVDVKYINTIYIEHNNVLNMDILYIPDEWAGDAATLEKEVLALMAERSIEKVDIAMLHGLFEYQLPAHIPNLLRLSEEFFLSIVRGYIHIGHIHTHNPRGRILPGGSVDRLAHNEEEDKGVILVNVDKDVYDYEFLVNNNAKIFKTINLDTVHNMSEVKAFLTKELKKLPKGSHVRLEAKSGASVFEGLVDIKRMFTDIYFSKKEIEDTNNRQDEEVDIQVKNLPVINAKTIVSVFGEYVSDKDINTSVKTMQNILQFHIEDTHA